MDKLDQQLQCSIKGQFDEGWKLVQELEKERPHCNRCAFNRAWYVLRNGDLLKGMELINRGRPEEVFGSPPIGSGKPIFNIRTDDIRNKYVLLNLEGGFGDEIIGFRFVNEIYDLGGRAIVACHPNLMSLFSNNFKLSAIVNSSAARLTYHDYWIPAMSAEYVFNHTYETLPNKKYLNINSDFIQKYYKIRENKNKLKIGIRYVGNPEFEHVQYRTFDENLLFNIFNDPEIKDKVEVYSLQKDLGVNKRLPDNIVDLESQLKTWDDTSGVIANLDLVISSCTSVAHLSAAMGKPTWIIVPVLSYYIWANSRPKDELSNGEYTRYYESARLFRQEKFGSWNEPFENIKIGLKRILENKKGK